MNELIPFSSVAGWPPGFGSGLGLLLAQADSGGGLNLWDTFSHAELFGKVIVVLLGFFSLIGWTVMIGKYLDLKRLRQLNLFCLAKLKQAPSLIGPGVPTSLRQGGPYARLFLDAYDAQLQYRDGGDPRVRMGMIENALQRAVAEECVRYETKMVVLGSLVTGAPFIGLLGTVWGVMVAFSGMGKGGGATLQNIAPGVASALLATVSGLLVAIPSVFGYNFLLTQVKMMITELENYASWLADRMELEFDAVKPPPAPAVPAPPTVSANPAPAPSGLPASVHSPAPAPAAPEPSAAERYLRFDASDDAAT